MQAPGFWDDSERAARTSARHAAAQRKLESYRSLESDIGDLGDLVEMAVEDPEIEAELERGNFIFPCPRVLAHAPGALAELRHCLAARQSDLRKR